MTQVVPQKLSQLCAVAVPDKARPIFLGDVVFALWLCHLARELHVKTCSCSRQCSGPQPAKPLSVPGEWLSAFILGWDLSRARLEKPALVEGVLPMEGAGIR